MAGALVPAIFDALQVAVAAFPSLPSDLPLLTARNLNDRFSYFRQIMVPP